ncbi:4-hydroxy-tetrahydrodipicolinate reductase [Weeksella virosa]|uniref:4-hydroxy-tetrahydrodipicolinate reductase n=1 Tax=Weeksella virosa (strain ATCC 43766 / DSM 16922 / JCM 21250 / CCUG 30538 / CDC 9751 / IAM 14551 / NBRC 16016 / NCTC 11634 / CL345/78) TaxID=865938 RepID=F0P241_WEEVC|nr:4-hydroxy-tetrahydrodipicolinate reductase [Weeksella virosa]ADX68769.1 Dihydrodipicolinate reductase [Weeksella virosa DSM 16922]MDK7374718.1 4-hydroxy-tetrahydrodipicolinate reductase [Weeksella virosa]MDK7675191.1 4-hydroxy-tetrahydrodipicolinate reductase [Weeksella virosa]SUP55120.1 Dihydrodipicolinate reductase [Weeksella virosa]VEH63560.1 Dihydrodipicolinate reductase [Weeksella virosa]
MKVALVGYGKMGKAIEEILVERGHEVVARINHLPTKEDINNAEIAIEFTQPNAAVNNIKALIELGLPTVSGTTGWSDSKNEIDSFVKEKNGALVTASNFSLGVNLFFELSKRFAELMRPYKNDYQIEIEEVHHTQKLDAPSGTAITLAEHLLAYSDYENWSMTEKSPTTIPVRALRVDEVPGTHSVTYTSAIDSLQLTHTAHSRKGFALGAVIAAEWLSGKKGVFGMKDVLGI